MGNIISQIAEPRFAMQVRHGEFLELAKLISEASTRDLQSRSARADENANRDSLTDLIAVIESAQEPSPDDSVIDRVVRTSPGQI